jgi:hypothetical protein
MPAASDLIRTGRDTSVQYDETRRRARISTKQHEFHRRRLKNIVKNHEWNLTEFWILVYCREVGRALIGGIVC